MIRAIAPRELHELLEAGGKDPGLPDGTIRVFDVRSAEAYEAGHVPGARHLPASHALRWVPQRAHTQELVVLIDEAGDRSGEARHVARELAHHWFRRLRFLDGGFEAWKEAALPLETGGLTGIHAGSHDGAELRFKKSGDVPWTVSLRSLPPDPARVRSEYQDEHEPA
jgi:rhodanese-related sulfurtransferase